MNDKPLAGRRIAITRSREQSSELAGRLSLLGAEIIELPLIKVSQEIDRQELADVMLEFGSYDWIVFTSTNGVRHFFDQFFRLFDDIRSLGLIRIACVGDSTARAVNALHLKVECLPPVATSKALAEALVETGSLDNAKVLSITGNLNRNEMELLLTASGAIVDSLQVYKTETVPIEAVPTAAEFRARGADAILFASSSAVRAYAARNRDLALEKAAKKPLVGSIGPQTSGAAKELGLGPDFEAKAPGLDGLVDATIRALRKGAK